MFTPIASAMNLLIPLYNSPQRHYHDLNHIHFCSSKLQEALSNAPYISMGKDLFTVFCLVNAVYFHDAIYSPYPQQMSSNERLSAILFVDHVYENYNMYHDQVRSIDRNKDKLEIFIDIVAEAIHATEYHLDLTGFEMKYPEMTKLVLDVDMAGFAKPFDEVYKDSDRIFKEYECLGLPHSVMLQNRIKFLKALLAKESIYHTEYFKKTHEYQARANIEAVIELSELDLKNME